MKVNVINWLMSQIEAGKLDENQVIAVYDKNNNVEYLGKAGFAPLCLWEEFKTATMVGNELRINERQVEKSTVKIVMERKGYKLTPISYFYTYESAKRYWERMTLAFKGDRTFEIHTTYKENVPFGTIIKL